MCQNFRIAVVGATGAVGRVILDLLAARGYRADQIIAMASSRSEGKELSYGENKLIARKSVPREFRGVNLAFVSATEEVSRELIPQIVDQGCVVIDDSAVWRMDPRVPLVIPEVNGNTVKHHRGILAIPNCSTTIMVMALWPLHRVNPIKRIIVDTYQSVSGTGVAAMTELERQSTDVLMGRKAFNEIYPHQIAFNLLPHIGSFQDSGYTSEEVKIMLETRKIMREPHIEISATCVRVPVLISHSEAVHVDFERPITAEEARTLFAAFPGVTVVDDPSTNTYPMPINGAGQNEIFIGRIRQNVFSPNGLAFWVVSDNLRKGAALNAIQIMEELKSRNCIPI